MRKGHRLLIPLMVAGFVHSAGAQTILIDYDDGVANGVHDAFVNDGGFESFGTVAGDATLAQFNDDDNATGNFTEWVNSANSGWIDLSNAQYEYEANGFIGTQPRTGDGSAFVGFNYNVIWGLATGYTLQNGDQFSGSFWFRSNNYLTNTVTVTLFYNSTDTMDAFTDLSDATDIYSFTATPTALSSYELYTFTTAVVPTEAIGKKLMFRIEKSTDTFTAGYGRVDDIYLEKWDGEAQPNIELFSAELANRPNPVVLSWAVTGTVTALEIDQGVGDVTGLTTNGVGSVEVYPPLGMQTYTLTLNGAASSQISVAGLPEKEKLHIYLLIGQSNMQGAGTPYSASLDAPDPRVVKFGSRNGMEQVFVKGGHPLTSLDTASSSAIGMGLEFGKTLLASQGDTNVVICLINHAIGSSAIQWWAPGVVDNKQVNPLTGLNYYLYDEAVQRVHDAESYGVLKGVLWHQGEYNANNNTDPNSEPVLYAGRLQQLVDNLRTEFDNPSLPFICGKFVPPPYYDGFFDRVTVEDALADLPNQRNNTFCVDNNGLSSPSGNAIHFDAHSQRLLGQRYAAAMINFYSDPYLLYLGGYLTPAQMADPLLTDPLGDNDNDRRDNYMEYALRFNPMLPDYSASINLDVSEQPPRLSFNKRTDTEAPFYWVDFSTNLVEWFSNAVFELEGSPIVHGDGSATVTVQPVENTPTAFFRLQVGP